MVRMTPGADEDDAAGVEEAAAEGVDTGFFLAEPVERAAEADGKVRIGAVFVLTERSGASDTVTLSGRASRNSVAVCDTGCVSAIRWLRRARHSSYLSAGS